MPGFDGTGPESDGPMTGRGAGYCAGYPTPGFVNPVPRMGMAWGTGMGYAAPGYGVGTGWGPGYAAPAYGFGAGSYLVKPVDFEKFTQLLDTFGYYWLAWNRFPD